ncbi:Serine/threonine-protein kinase VRK1 [Frankliniella fusca]|uniref:Serine/threonine-protein kinase VRK1 n=1 Tax=Frankliniella fusca TaxID=407009 RepID=A0AAE1L945_9NEOP|nr:Serine/threonine-protein kinase VRK1 [Frankliniella fusca]
MPQKTVRQLRTTLPVLTSRLKPSVVPRDVTKLTQKSKNAKKNYDRTASFEEQQFSPSDYVFIKNPITCKWKPGIIVDSCEEPRSYLVKTNFSNNVIRSNSTFLKPRNVYAPISTPVYLLPDRATNNVQIPNNEQPVNNQNVIPLQQVNQD